MHQFRNILFFALLAFWGAWLFFQPEKARSEEEKRDLQPLPAFNWDSYWKGQYTDSLSKYLADHFAFRQPLVQLSFWMERHRGIHQEEIGVYTGNMDFDAGIEEMQEFKDSLNQANADKQKRDPNLFFNEGKAEDVDRGHQRLLIYKGQGIQIFGGINTTKDYGRSDKFNASIINEYQDSLKGRVQVHAVITPASGELFLPTEYKKEHPSERAAIDSIYHYIDASINTADVCAELHRHKDEYLFFATDHHWTGRGAYYGYVAWAKSAGIQPVPLEKLERKVIPNFTGSFLRMTQDQRLADNPDSVEYFKLPIQHVTYKVEGARHDKLEKKRLFVEFAKDEHAYGVFLGSDPPIYCVDTDVKTDRVAVLVKNSYGNPFSTFLPLHFNRVFIIDYRKFKGNLIELCRKNKVTDLIILQSVFSSNTGSHGAMIRNLIHQKGPCVQIPKDSTAFQNQ